MNRKVLPAVLFTVWMGCSAAFAQTLVVPPLTSAGKIADIRIDDLPEGSRVLFQASPGADVRNAGLGRAHATGVTGSHPLSAVIAPKDGDLIALTGVLVIGDAPPTPPPVVKTLAQLAGDKAPALSAMYAGFLDALNADLFTDVAHFGRTEAAGLKQRNLTGHGATAAIAKRLDVGTLDELKAAVAAVVEELGAPAPVPPTPPVVEGKRFLYLIRETTNIDTDLARVVEDIQGGGNAESQYLASKGHRMILLDPDDVDPAGQPSGLFKKLQGELTGLALPAVIVTDQSTGAVLLKLSINPDTITAVQLVDFVQSTGG